MSYGMTYDEFWTCRPSRYKAYRELNKLRAERRNQEMWWQGFYVFRAIETALHNQPALAVKPPTPISYLEEPIRITPLTEQEKHEQEEKKKQDFVNYLMSVQKAWEQKHGSNSSN